MTEFSKQQAIFPCVLICLIPIFSPLVFVIWNTFIPEYTYCTSISLKSGSTQSTVIVIFNCLYCGVLGFVELEMETLMDTILF